MTRRLVDLSDYQAGLDVDTVAASVDGAWCKVGDWAWVTRYGWPADDIHDAVIRRFLQLGKPVGSYLFVRPGWTTAAAQIEGWRAHCPDGTTIAPMIDLEVPGTLSGGFLRDWVDAALRRTAELFGMTPVLYWSAAFAQAYGMTAPAALHIPMVAEYHWGYQTQLWADRASWEAHAYSAYGGPDVPPGYGSAVTPRSLIWQWTSSAQVPGFRGLVDHDFVPEAAWQLIADAPLPPSSVDDIIEAIMADPTLAADLRAFITVFGLDGAHSLADVWNRTKADHSKIEAADLDALVYVRNNFNALHGTGTDGPDVPATYLPGAFAEVHAALDKLAVGGDLDKLAEAVAAKVIAAEGPPLDAKEIARAVLDAFGQALGGEAAPIVTTPASAVAELPDPDPQRRAAVALADLATSVFDTDTGVAAVVGRQLANMRPAPGVEVSNEDIAGAVEGALADAANRAGVKAASLPPLPPIPTPTGDMGGSPTP